MTKRILVVDDASSIRQVVSLVLTEKGYEVIEAEDGKDAISKISNNNVDIIICDVNMPNMNGLEFLEFMKTDESMSALKFVPFIMLTTEASDNMKKKGMELGMKVWLVKPFKPEELVDAVKKLIG